MPNKKAPAKSDARQNDAVAKHSLSSADSSKIARIEKLATKLRNPRGDRKKHGGGHWTRKDGLAAARFCIESGMSQTAFCKRFGLSPHRIKYWSDRLEAEVRPPTEEATPILTIHPVQVNGGVSVPQLKCEPELDIDDIELITPTGLKIRLGPRFNAATLRRLLEVVEC